MPFADFVHTRYRGISEKRLLLFAAMSAVLHVVLVFFIVRSPMMKHDQIQSMETYLVAHPSSISAVSKQAAQAATVSLPSSSEGPHVQVPASLQQTPVPTVPAAVQVQRSQPDISLVKETVALNPVYKAPETGVAAKGGNPAQTTANPVITGRDANLASLSGVAGVSETVGVMNLGDTGAPHFVHREPPAYPFLARRLGKEGKVIVRLTLDETGRQKNIEIIEPGGFGFTDAAVEALKKSIFTPARLNGKAISSRVLVPVRFVLNN